MASARLFLYVSLAFVSLLLWERWNDWNRPPGTTLAPPAPSGGEQSPAPPWEAPALAPGEAPDDVPPASESDISQTPAVQERPEQAPTAGVTVETDLFLLELGLRGGDVRRADLRQVLVDIKDPDTPLRLLDNRKEVYLVQTGLLHDRVPGIAEPVQRAPSHHAPYTSRRKHYALSAGEDYLRVPLVWRSGSIEVEKTYVFRRGSYLIGIEHTVRNRSTQTWVGRQYAQLRRTSPEDNGSPLLYTFTGAAYYDGKYNKVAFDEIAEEPLAQPIVGGWAAMLQHYFVSALIPAADAQHDYYTKAVRGMGRTEYLVGLRSSPLVVAPGGSEQFSIHLYSGPKNQHDLEHTAPGLELTTDYGIFTVISKPLFWLLDQLYSFLGNWGWAIIVLTLLIKLVFYKLSEVSYRSMARMRKFQPRLMALRERYKDDRSRLSQEMMSLYRQEKVNPLSGCLPILVQIPVFIALYWVLLESVELRHAPFILWIHDLSARDPFFVLPLLMGATMLVQHKLNPTPPDPLQAKVMMALPIVFTFFFAFFPSGLVLYWFVNNLLSIAQQWVITRAVLEKKA